MKAPILRLLFGLTLLQVTFVSAQANEISFDSYRDHFDQAFQTQVCFETKVEIKEPYLQVWNRTTDNQFLSVTEFRKQTEAFIENYLNENPPPASWGKEIEQIESIGSSQRFVEPLPIVAQWPGGEKTLAMYVANMAEWAVDRDSIGGAQAFFHFVGDIPYTEESDPLVLRHSTGENHRKPYSVDQLFFIHEKLVRFNEDRPIDIFDHSWLQTSAARNTYSLMRAQLVNDMAQLFEDGEVVSDFVFMLTDPETAVDAIKRSLATSGKLVKADESRRLSAYANWFPDDFLLLVNRRLHKQASELMWQKLVNIHQFGTAAYSDYDLQLLSWATNGRFKPPVVNEQYREELGKIVEDLYGFELATMQNKYGTWMGIQIPAAIKRRQIVGLNIGNLYRITDVETGAYETWTPFAIAKDPAAVNDGVQRWGEVSGSTTSGVMWRERITRRDFNANSTYLLTSEQMEHFYEKLPTKLEKADKAIRQQITVCTFMLSVALAPVTLAGSASLAAAQLTLQQVIRLAVVGIIIHEGFHFGTAAYHWYQTGEWQNPDVYDITVGALTTGALTVFGGGIANFAAKIPYIGRSIYSPLFLAALTGTFAKVQGSSNAAAIATGIKFGAMTSFLRIATAYNMATRMGAAKTATTLFVANSAVSYSTGMFGPHQADESRVDAGIRNAAAHVGLNVAGSALFLLDRLGMIIRPKPPKPAVPIIQFPGRNGIVSSPSPSLSTRVEGSLALKTQPQSLPQARVLQHPSASQLTAVQHAQPEATQTLALAAEASKEDVLAPSPLRKLFEVERFAMGIFTDSDAAFSQWLNARHMNGGASAYRQRLGFVKQHHGVKYDGNWMKIAKFGTTLCGVLPKTPLEGFPFVDEDAKAVVIAFGGSGALISSARAWLKYATALDKYGVSVVAVSHPFHDGGPRNERFRNPEDYYSWVGSIISDYGKQNRPIIIVGKSFGAAVVQEHVYRSANSVDGAIMFAPGADLTPVMAQMKEAFESSVSLEKNVQGSAWETRMNKGMQSIGKQISATTPVRVVASENDEYSTPEELATVAGQFANGQVHIVSGGDHIYFLDYREPNADETLVVLQTLDLISEVLGEADMLWEKSDRKLSDQAKVGHLYAMSGLFQSFIQGTGQTHQRLHG